MFRITHKDKKTKARLGVLSTPHGKVLTPSYVFVGTYGRFLHLAPRDIKKTKTQLVIANTFHLWDTVCSSDLSGKTFLTKRLGLNIPTMTDSGGFQVLSLAFGPVVDARATSLNKKLGHHYGVRRHGIGKFIGDNIKSDKDYKRKNIRITNKGVYFKWDGKIRFLGPELSMKLQSKIGADIIFAFDQITSPLDDYEYNRKAVELTNAWALRCLKAHARQLRRLDNKSRVGAPTEASGVGKKQLLFGIVQGGLFKDLRTKSAKSIGSMPFDGFGIGGSYTKKQISKMLKWVVPHLPEEKPRHLLGVGKVADIFEAIQNGIDTFDCVIPTREARHGRLYTKIGHLDIRKGRYSDDKKVIERGCGCLTCSKKISRSKIRELIKSDNTKLNTDGQRWCLMHNMWFFNNLLEEIRKSIQKEKFGEFKKKTLTKFV